MGVIPGIALDFLPWDSAAIYILRVINWIPELITDHIHTHITGGPPEERFFILLPITFFFWLLAGVIGGHILKRHSGKRDGPRS